MRIEANDVRRRHGVSMRVCLVRHVIAFRPERPRDPFAIKETWNG